MSWARKIITGSPSVKAVLMAIANYADEDGMCWPSQEMLAADTELSRHTVMRCMETLEEQGMITRQRQHRGDGSRKSDRIVLDLSSTVQRSTSQRSTVEEPKSHHATAEPITEPITDRIDADVREAVQLWNDLAKELDLPKVQKLTNTRISKLKARLKDCGGMPGWTAAMDKIRGSPHCRGENDRGWRADIDFALQETTFVRLMEGRYDSRKQNRIGAGKLTTSQSGQLLDAVIAEAARREAGFG